MSASTRDVKTKFTFEVDNDKLEKIEGALEGIKHRLEFLGGIELAKGLFEISEKFSKFAENIHIASVSAGIGVEAFQKLAFAARLSAVPQEQLEVSLARLSRSLYKARQGSAEAQLAFSKAGFTPDQIHGFKTSQEALLALADRIKAIPDPIERVALAQQLLGRGSQRMVGFLAQGSGAIKDLGKESDKLGIALSEHQVEALVRVEQALQKFWALIQAIGASIAANFAPNLEAAIKAFLEFYQANQRLIQTNIKRWIEEFAFALGFVYGIIEGLINLLIRLAKQFHLENDIIPFLEKFVGFIGGIFLLGKVFGFVGNQVMGVFRAIRLLGAAITFLTGIEWAAVAPWIAIAAAIGVAAYLLDKMISEFTGNQSVLESLGGFSGISKSVVGAISGAGASFPLPQSVGGPSVSQSSQVQIMAPITQNISGGDATEIAGKSARGLTDHLTGTQNRATRRGVTSPRAY